MTPMTSLKSDGLSLVMLVDVVEVWMVMSTCVAEAGLIYPVPFLQPQFIGYQKHFSGLKAPPVTRKLFDQHVTAAWCLVATDVADSVA